MNTHRHIFTYRLVSAGISLLVVICGSQRAAALQTFETPSTANVSETMHRHDPHLLSITFRAQAPVEPAEIPPKPKLFAANDQGAPAPDTFFQAPQPLVEPAPQQSVPEIREGEVAKQPIATPEPSSLVLLIIGLGGGALWLGRRRLSQTRTNGQ